jgi:RNA polymerase sigma factor (sigma-70 family)
MTGTSQNTTTSAAAPAADADIHARLQAKQYREAFAMLLPRYRDKVFRLTYSMLQNHAMAEDTTQDIFLRVWRALPGYAAQASLSTWIYAISKNACLSEFRKRRPTVSIDGDEDDYNPEVAALAAPDPDDSATVSVGQLLDQLPERYRQAVTLFYMEDKSYEQTAAALGLPLGTVKALLHRARKRLIELTRETQQADAA